MELLPLSIEEQKLEAIAQEYSIRSIALFGSVLRSDFGPKSCREQRELGQSSHQGIAVTVLLTARG